MKEVFKPIYRVAGPAFLAISSACSAGKSNNEPQTTYEPLTIPVSRNLPEQTPIYRDFYVAPKAYEIPSIKNTPKEIQKPKPAGVESSKSDPDTDIPASENRTEYNDPAFETPSAIDTLDFSPKVSQCGLDLWEQDDRAKFLEIPAIGFASPVKLAPLVPESDDSEDKTYDTPVEDIATPENVIADSIYLFGHSSWEGLRRPIANIEYLEPGNLIKVTDEKEEVSCFAVSKFALVNKESPRTLRGPFDVPTVVMQTSAKLEGEVWLLDEENVQTKVGENKPEDPSGYQALLVYGEPIGEEEQETP